VRQMQTQSVETLQRRERRISDPDSFDVYFQFDVPSTDISKSQMNALLDRLSLETFRSDLTAFIDEDIEKGITFLERLRDHLDDPRLLSNAQTVVRVLFDIGDRFPQDIRRFPFRLDGGTLIMQLVYQLLRRIQSDRYRYTILTTAIATAQESLDPLVTTVSVEGAAHGRHGPGGGKESSVEQQLVSDANLDILEQQARRKIEDWAKGDGGGRLADHPKLAHILYRWAEWADRATVEDYVLNRLDAANFAKLVALAAVNAGMPSDKPTLDSDSVRALFDPAAALERLRTIMSGPDSSVVPPDIRSTLEELLR
jgi:predicted KAP-like P-loop ATPase